MNTKLLTPLILLFLVNPLYALDTDELSEPSKIGPSPFQEGPVSPLAVAANEVLEPDPKR